MIEAKAICDSIGPTGDHSRLITMSARYPKFIHAEHCRHRSFSFSVSSSRAIPVAKNLEEVRSDELRATPVWWGREQKGMQSGDKLSNSFNMNVVVSCTREHRGVISEQRRAEIQWKRAALEAANTAEYLSSCQVHKSIVNRILEPFLHVNVLVTGTTPGWMNFFGLRLDKAAQPEMRVLAEVMWKVWNESRPQKLEPGQWHLPFIEGDAVEFWKDSKSVNHAWLGDDKTQELMIRISVARCARLSYLSFETDKRSTIEEDLRLYDRLVGSSPIHASPAEHQATPDVVDYIVDSDSNPEWSKVSWKHPELAGNLGPGWRQYRKMLPNEAVAPLPGGYV